MAQKTSFNFKPKKEALIPGQLYVLPAQALKDLSDVISDELPVRFSGVAGKLIAILTCADSLEVPEAAEATEAPAEAPALTVSGGEEPVAP